MGAAAAAALLARHQGVLQRQIFGNGIIRRRLNMEARYQANEDGSIIMARPFDESSNIKNIRR